LKNNVRFTEFGERDFRFSEIGSGSSIGIIHEEQSGSLFGDADPVGPGELLYLPYAAKPESCYPVSFGNIEVYKEQHLSDSRLIKVQKKCIEVT